MNTQEARQQVLSAFESATCYYSNELPLVYNDFIDGMAWVGLLCGVAYKKGDTELAQLSENYLGRLLQVGPDARNFAPTQVESDWVVSPSIPGYWYKKDPQDFAGPAGLRFAIDNGAHLNDPFQVKGRARLMVMGGWLFGLSVRFISGLHQHINSMFLAYLILDKKPASTMLWMCEDNPFFSYIAGKKCLTEYPDNSSVTGGDTVDESGIVPLKDRKPNAWIFRNWPKSRYIREGSPNKTYTPIWQVVGDYCQSFL